MSEEQNQVRAAGFSDQQHTAGDRDDSADPGGYTTQFVLFTGESARPISGFLTLNPTQPAN